MVVVRNVVGGVDVRVVEGEASSVIWRLFLEHGQMSGIPTTARRSSKLRLLHKLPHVLRHVVLVTLRRSGCGVRSWMPLHGLLSSNVTPRRSGCGVSSWMPLHGPTSSNVTRMRSGNAVRS